uniref:Putative DNA polymerase n=1 Tax=viral metagenome TaxID=1070528 RepID=A0A6M3J598_9ZZZZ
MPNSVQAFGNLPSGGLSQILQELTSARLVAVDTETVSIEDKTMLGLAIAPSPDYAVWFGEDSPYLHIALSILRNPAVKKLLYNSKFDFDVLEPFGIDETNFEDPMILAYTLNLPQKLYNLGAHLGKQVPDKFFNFTIPPKGTMLDVWNSDPDFVLQKCCIDASLTYWCWEKLHSPSPAFYIPGSYAIDRDIVHCLRNMEHRGVRLNQPSVAEFYTELDEQVTYMRQLIQTKGCDPNSNQQVGIALAQKGWKLRYTKSRKQLKVDERSLQNIDDPLAQSVLIYREKAKLLSTYVKPLLGLERAYTHYNNTRVITGRLSSSDPINMQNIPNFFRVVFLADDGSVVWSFDANQIELRSLAYLAQDKAMMDAFASGHDIHKETMDRMGITGNLANPVEARRLAKVLNFATAYLGEEETIIENAKKEGIRITPPQATDFRRRYFETYTGIRDYVYSQREWIIKYGYVQTLFGRVRKLDPIRMANPHSREAVIREMFNMPVQGTAAEIIKKMMAKAKDYDLRIQVHDEMVYNNSCPPPSLFSGVAPFLTPVKLSMGESWGDLKKLETS